ncbi:hypothetical protein GGR01_002734 [Acetobacter oeni]|nr:hypothetical protein [Acetobacter oeni]
MTIYFKKRGSDTTCLENLQKISAFSKLETDIDTWFTCMTILQE